MVKRRGLVCARHSTYLKGWPRLACPLVETQLQPAACWQMHGETWHSNHLLRILGQLWRRAALSSWQVALVLMQLASQKPRNCTTTCHAALDTRSLAAIVQQECRAQHGSSRRSAYTDGDAHVPAQVGIHDHRSKTTRPPRLHTK